MNYSARDPIDSHQVDNSLLQQSNGIRVDSCTTYQVESIPMFEVGEHQVRSSPTDPKDNLQAPNTPTIRVDTTPIFDVDEHKVTGMPTLYSDSHRPGVMNPVEIIPILDTNTHYTDSSPTYDDSSCTQTINHYDDSSCTQTINHIPRDQGETKLPTHLDRNERADGTPAKLTDCKPGTATACAEMGSEQSIPREAQKPSLDLKRFTGSFMKKEVSRSDKEKCNLWYNSSQLSELQVQEVSESIALNQTLKFLIILNMPPKWIEPLGTFICQEKTIQSVRFEEGNGTPYLTVRKSGKTSRKYFINNENTHFVSAAAMLHDYLCGFLDANSISSAFKAKDNKLVLFLPRQQEDEIGRVLHAKIKRFQNSNGHIDISRQYEIVYLEYPFEVDEQNSAETCSPGSSVKFECRGDEIIQATVGVVVKDQDDKICVLSSAHGKNVQHSYVLGETSKKEHEVKYIGEVYSNSPFMDGCILEIDTSRITPRSFLQDTGANAALYGPYTGPSSDLEDLAVLKFGAQTKLTKGVLIYHGFHLRAKGISGALVFSPGKKGTTFAAKGDSGSVIFRETPESHKPSSTSKHEAIAMHSLALKGFEGSNDTWSLGFRLDNFFGELEDQVDRKVSFLPISRSIEY